MTDFQTAIVAGIYRDGISLIFPGSSSPSSKHYRCNSSIPFAVGQRVRVEKINGTYIVAYPIGPPVIS